MENEIMTNEIEVVEDVEVVEEQPQKSGAGIIALAVGAGIVAGVTALICKNKHKFEEYRIKKLEKKGYVVYKPKLECDDSEIEVVDAEYEEVESN